MSIERIDLSRAWRQISDVRITVLCKVGGICGSLTHQTPAMPERSSPRLRGGRRVWYNSLRQAKGAAPDNG